PEFDLALERETFGQQAVGVARAGSGKPFAVQAEASGEVRWGDGVEVGWIATGAAVYCDVEAGGLAVQGAVEQGAEVEGEGATFDEGGAVGGVLDGIGEDEGFLFLVGDEPRAEGAVESDAGQGGHGRAEEPDGVGGIADGAALVSGGPAIGSDGYRQPCGFRGLGIDCVFTAVNVGRAGIFGSVSVAVTIWCGLWLVCAGFQGAGVEPARAGFVFVDGHDGAYAGAVGQAGLPDASRPAF